MIERAEKQTILARHARRLLNFIDDNPVVPGDAPRAYDHEAAARKVLDDAENDLRAWHPSEEPIATSAGQEPRVSERDEERLIAGAGEAGPSQQANGTPTEKAAEEPHSSGAIQTEDQPVPA